MRYFIRSVKYCLLLVAIFFVVTFMMSFTGELELTIDEQMALFMANNGALKIAFLIVLSALYPSFGFVKREVDGSVVENRDQIVVAMEASGFTFKRENNGALIFSANTIFRRVTFLFEDEITVSQSGDKIIIEGVRRGVVYIVYCLDGFIKNSRRVE